MESPKKRKKKAPPVKYKKMSLAAKYRWRDRRKREKEEEREKIRQERNALIEEAQKKGYRKEYKSKNYIPIPMEENKMFGNKFWELRSEHGPSTLFSDPDILLAEGIKYFEWCVENPLYKTEVRTITLAKGEGSRAELVQVPILRAFTWHGLEQFLRVSNLRNYKSNPKYAIFSHVMEFFESVIYRQKFEGAAGGLLDSQIISRDLGLKDKTDITTNGGSINAPSAIQINFKSRGRDVIAEKKKAKKLK